MKKVQLFFGAILMFTMFSFVALQEAPKAVIESFSHKFPTAKDLKWSKEKNNEWEAEFKMDKTKYSAIFLENGMWKETEHQIEISKILPEMQANLDKSYPSYLIEEAEMSETKEGIVYEFEMKKGKSKVEVTMDKSGKILKRNPMK